MKALGILLLLLGAVVGYFTVIDRQTALALSMVEAVPHPSTWAGLVGLGLALIGVDVGRGLLAKAEAPPRREPRKPPEKLPAPDAIRRPPPTRARILARAKDFSFGNKVRVELDASPGVPVTIVLQHMSPQSVKRTLEQVAAWVEGIPRPPRIRIEFVQCPEGPNPRNRQVTGAFATHLPRSAFKATSHLEYVEVLFFDPDPEWKEIWGT